MRSIRVDAVAQKDGEVHLSDLPCRKGDRVEAVVSFPDSADVTARQAARQRFLARANASRFRSTGQYPSRDELR